MDELFEKQGEKGKLAGFNAREFIARYLKYLPLFIALPVLFFILAKIKLRYSIEIYEVKSKLHIKENSNYGEDKFRNLFMAPESQNMNDEIEILKSTGLSKRVVSKLGIQTTYLNKGKVKNSLIHPNYAPIRLDIIELIDSSQAIGMELHFLNETSFTINNDTKPVYLGQVFELPSGKMRVVKGPLGFEKFGSNEFIISWQPLYDAAAAIAGSFRIGPVSDYSNVLQITLETENPRLGQDIVNQLMTEYNISSVEDKREITVNTLQFIDERLDTLKSELGGVEQHLQQYQETNKAIDLEQQAVIGFNELSEVTRLLTEQEVRLKMVEYLYDYISDSRNTNKTVPVQLGIDEPSLSALIVQYNNTQLELAAELKRTPEANPLIVQLKTSLDKLRQQILENLRNVRQSYLINRNNLLQKTRSAESNISSVPGKTKRLLEITREQKILEELYSFLLQKKLETSISSASAISKSKVLEPAQPSSMPVRPNRKSIYMVALLLGIAIPVGFIFLLEFLNDKIRSRADVERLISAPILGEVGHSQEGHTLVVTKNNRKFIAEQFRIIRTNLQYVISKVQRPVILVTSSFSGEGKSFVSTNIGAVLAVAGKKTVILEFDIRKPKIIAGLDLARKTGITNFIVGNVNIEDIILPVQQVENLYVIPCGPLPPNPAELLLDEKVKELFYYLRENFEAVIVDSAPVGLVSDAIILSNHVDATLYILRENYTLKKQADLINELYKEKKLPKLSLLLNDVKSSTSSGYYGYGYGHGSGYFAEEDKKTGILPWLKKRFS